jgi:hypothetical protein
MLITIVVAPALIIDYFMSIATGLDILWANGDFAVTTRDV